MTSIMLVFFWMNLLQARPPQDLIIQEGYNEFGEPIKKLQEKDLIYNSPDKKAFSEGPAPNVSQDSVEEFYFMEVTESINAFTRPSSTSKIKFRIPKGTKVKFLKTTEASPQWIAVEVVDDSKKKGWIQKRFAVRL